jgi:hypothetical protein
MWKVLCEPSANMNRTCLVAEALATDCGEGGIVRSGARLICTRILIAGDSGADFIESVVHSTGKQGKRPGIEAAEWHREPLPDCDL